jgi:hypothetical protein
MSRCGAAPRPPGHNVTNPSQPGKRGHEPTPYRGSCRRNRQGNIKVGTLLLAQVNDKPVRSMLAVPYIPPFSVFRLMPVHVSMRSFHQAPSSPKMLSLRLLGTAFVTWPPVLASNGVHGSDNVHPVLPDGTPEWSPNNASIPMSGLLPRQLPKGECNADTPCVIEACCNGQYVRAGSNSLIPICFEYLMYNY